MAKIIRSSKQQTAPVQTTPLDNTQELLSFIGQQAKAARLRLGVTQAEVAALADTSSSQIFLIESGQSNMTMRSLIVLAGVLGVEVSEFFPRPTTAVERPDAKHVFSTIADGFGRVKNDIEQLEGLLETLKSLDKRHMR